MNWLIDLGYWNHDTGSEDRPQSYASVSSPGGNLVETPDERTGPNHDDKAQRSERSCAPRPTEEPLLLTSCTEYRDPGHAATRESLLPTSLDSSITTLQASPQPSTPTSYVTSSSCVKDWTEDLPVAASLSRETSETTELSSTLGSTDLNCDFCGIPCDDVDLLWYVLTLGMRTRAITLTRS